MSVGYYCDIIHKMCVDEINTKRKYNKYILAGPTDPSCLRVLIGSNMIKFIKTLPTSVLREFSGEPAKSKRWEVPIWRAINSSMQENHPEDIHNEIIAKFQ